MVKWLLDGRPSQVNATNHEGRTPLHIAAATDNADLCRLLLDRGAEVNPVARSSKNEPLTPLDCATSRGHRSTAKYLQMHGGLPASKLANTEIVIDGAPITTLPTRRVTSTKIDVRDRIRIEKREIVELSSPVHERRRIKDKNHSDSTSSSTDDRKTRRRSDSKYSKKPHDKRKRLIEPQKSFSDGYDTEFDGHIPYGRDESHDRKHTKGSKKSRSKSEPSRRSKSSDKYRKHYRSGSASSSDTDSYSEKKKSKRHRKRSKKKTSSLSESSSSETSERRSTKRKGKKTSIHIENDDRKQSVNIVKYKRSDTFQDIDDPTEGVSKILSKNDGGDVAKAETDKEENTPLVKSKTLSETETDTLSVKTNMIVTEAQIHMERESSQHGSSEITVTVDSSNNVSIETANLSVMHKDLTEERKTDLEPQVEDGDVCQEKADTSSDKIDSETKIEVNEDESTEKKESQSSKEQEQNSDKTEIGKSESKPVQTEAKPEGEILQKSESKETEDIGSSTQPGDDAKTEETSSSFTIEQTRKRSFQVLSGPEDTLLDNKETISGTENVSGEQTETREKSGSPAVSFAKQDVIFQSQESDKQSEHLMGEEVDHSEVGHETDDQIPNKMQKDSSSNTMSSEDKRKDFSSTTGSSTEIVQNVDKGLVTIIDGNVPVADRAVQQVIMESASEDFDVNLPLSQSSPKRIRKASLVSSRKSSIYETESYKVLSDIPSAPDVSGSPGILKKSIKLTEGSLDEDKDEPFEGIKIVKDGSLGRVPSVSDNEIYSHSEVNGRRKRFRKKGRTKSRITIRSKSENSERGYESSGLMDSGFEPSPRAVQRRIVSPRLAAYYQQRNASGRYSGKSDSRIPVRKPGDKNAVDMKSVTQRIQTNMRRWVHYKFISRK